MANYRTIKLASEAGVPGVEFIKRDNSVYEVTIGGLRIVSDYGLKVMVLEPFEAVKRFRVEAKLPGFAPAINYFDGEWDARDLLASYGNTDAVIVKGMVDVRIDDAGKVHSIDGSPIELTDDGEMVPF